MAWLSRLRWLQCIRNRVCFKTDIDQVNVRQLSFNTTPSHQEPDSKSNCNVELGVTRNGKTVVCIHPAVDFSYEFTKPIPREDFTTDSAESFDLVLKSQVEHKLLKNKKSSTMEELSKVFYTTKHCWYPVGQYHSRRRNKNPPKDRFV